MHKISRMYRKGFNVIKFNYTRNLCIFFVAQKKQAKVQTLSLKS